MATHMHIDEIDRITRGYCESAGYSTWVPGTIFKAATKQSTAIYMKSDESVVPLGHIMMITEGGVNPTGVDVSGTITMVGSSDTNKHLFDDEAGLMEYLCKTFVTGDAFDAKLTENKEIMIETNKRESILHAKKEDDRRLDGLCRQYMQTEQLTSMVSEMIRTIQCRFPKSLKNTNFKAILMRVISHELIQINSMLENHDSRPDQPFRELEFDSKDISDDKLTQILPIYVSKDILKQNITDTIQHVTTQSASSSDSNIRNRAIKVTELTLCEIVACSELPQNHGACVVAARLDQMAPTTSTHLWGAMNKLAALLEQVSIKDTI